jgi:hypothetical protein
VWTFLKVACFGGRGENGKGVVSATFCLCRYVSMFGRGVWLLLYLKTFLSNKRIIFIKINNIIIILIIKL